MNIYIDGCSCFLDEVMGPEGLYLSLTALRTKSEARRKGAAKKVLRTAKKIGRERGCRVILFVAAFWDRPVSNSDLYAFYTRMGFKPMGKGWGSTYLAYTPSRRR